MLLTFSPIAMEFELFIINHHFKKMLDYNKNIVCEKLRTERIIVAFTQHSAW